MQSGQLQLSFPDVVEGYSLDGDKGLFSVVVPEYTENLIINPSPMLNLTGYSAMAGAIALSTTKQHRSVNSVRVTPTNAVSDGAYYGNVTTVAGWNTFSLDFYGAPGVPYKIYFATNAGAQLGTPVTFIGEDLWRRPVVKLYETAPTARRLYFTKNNSASTAYFYVDGLQLEAKDHPTTYCDGEMIGFLPGQSAYYWTGARFASSSVRILDTASGGRVVPLSDYNFTTLGYTGLSLSAVNNITFPYARVDGENYQTTKVEARSFSILGAVSGRTPEEFLFNRRGIAELFSPSRCSTRQPCLILYQYRDALGNIPSDYIYKIVGYYVDGLSGNNTNKFQEKLGLNFRSSSPLIEIDGYNGLVLSYQTTINNVNYILKRDLTGLWATMAGGGNGAVLDALIGPDGSLYVVGAFTSMGGVANTSGIARWDGASWNAVGTGVTGGNTVRCIALGPNNVIYVGGDFSQMGGVAGTNRMAKWDGAVWTNLGTGIMIGGSYSIVFDNAGNLYTGGAFPTINGVANTSRIAKWDGANWTALSTGADNRVEDVVIGNDGTLYIGGIFLNVGGVAANRIAKWNGTAWSILSTGANSDVYALTIGPDGRLYARGMFTTMGGIPGTSGVAVWNGTAWQAMGTGLSGIGGGLDNGGLSFIDNLLYISGDFTGAGGTATPQGAIIWNGSNYMPLDILPPAGGGILIPVLIKNKLGYLFSSMSTAGTAIAAATNTFNNLSTTYSFPVISFLGPGTLYQLKNYTTGDTIYFNLTLFAGETAILNLTPGQVSFISSLRGPLTNVFLPGSNQNSFRVAPGVNYISCFIAGTTSAATSAVLVSPRLVNYL
jgi:hypothetical protein